MTKEQSKDNETGRYKERYSIATLDGKKCIIDYTYYDYADEDTCGYKGDVKRAHVYFSDGSGVSRNYDKLVFEELNVNNIKQISEAMELKRILDIKLLNDELQRINNNLAHIKKRKSEILIALKMYGVKNEA